MQIKLMETPEEIDGKAFVHYQAFQEAYAGLWPQEFLDNLTIENCQKIAHTYPRQVSFTRSTSSRSIMARGLAMPLCRLSWKNCRAMSMFASGSWRVTIGLLISMNRSALSLTG